MKTRLTAGLALTGAVILASCAQDQPSSRLLPTQASLSVAPAACSFPAIYAAADSYFSQSNDPVYQLVITMEHAHISGGAPRRPARASTCSLDSASRPISEAR